jgi:hypothetical protein
LGSLFVSTQAPLHSMSGWMQAKSQVPATQVGVAPAGGMHTVVQLPQCSVLLIRSTQEPSQLVVPPPHAVPHFPPAQTCPEEQVVVQPPQCALSLAVSTHSSPQRSYPKLQAMSQPVAVQTAVLFGLA